MTIETVADISDTNMEYREPDRYAAQRATFAERVAYFDSELPGYATLWAELDQHLTSIGGDVVVAHLAPDATLGELLAGGISTNGVGALVDPGEPCGCHRNAATLWVAGATSSAEPVSAIGTGYALSDDGMWREHSWAIAASGQIVETTTTRDWYFGVTLTGDAARRFASAQGAGT